MEPADGPETGGVGRAESDNRLARGGQNIEGQEETNHEIGERTMPTEEVEKDHVKERKRPLKKEDRVCRANGELEEGRLQKTVRALEERLEEPNNRVCVLEGNSDGEEKERRHRRTEDMRRIGDGTMEAWWLRQPWVGGGRLNAR